MRKWSKISLAPFFLQIPYHPYLPTFTIKDQAFMWVIYHNIPGPGPWIHASHGMKKIHHQIQRIYLGSKWHNDASHNVFWWSFWVPPTYRPQGWWKNPPNDRGYQTMQICMVLLGDLNGFALENAMFGLVIHHDPWFNLEIDDISHMPFLGHFSLCRW